MSKNVTHLIDQFIPEHYILSLHPDKKTMTFDGSVTITGRKVGRPAKRITFHQKNLKIKSAVLKRTDKHTKNIELSRINLQKNFEELRLHSDDMIYPGQYEIIIEFSGIITENMDGLYPCKFRHDGKDKMLLATQFESHHAREVFPCIDEPAAKATFDLSLISTKGEVVISNTPIKDQTHKGNLTFTTFETSPKMSSYLLAFVIGEMKHLEAKTKSGITVRTYATPDNAKFTNFALDVGVKTLDFYEEYFGIPYPLEKCDMIALPDFASGAMENWGCITYREHGLFVDPKNTSLPSKQYVAMVVAHELAHQWFGNLVTMRWWTDLWLNEGFATWIEYLAVDRLFPEWNMWSQFIVDEQQVAMKLDALDNTHPIEAPINHPDEIRTIFDSISYSKGSSVIHMLYSYLGPNMFRDGLRYYLEKHKYGNTDTVDLWDALESISQKPVTEFMQKWITQPGFPIVFADIDEKKIKLKQQRFLLSGQDEKEKSLWPIPLGFSEKTGVDTKAMTDKSIVLNDVKNTSYLKLNSEQSGFYRTVYNSTHLEKLAEAIRAGKIDPVDRLGILNDTFEAVKAGYGDTADALHLLESYGNETSSPVWDVIAGSIGSIRAVMDDEDLRELMKPYVRKLVTKQLKRLGWKGNKNEEYFDQLLRPTILGMAAAAEAPDVIAECLAQFNAMEKLEDIAPDLRGVIFSTVARNGGEEEFSRFVDIHNSSQSSEDRMVMTAAITSFEQPELIDKALKMIKTKDVRLQDIAYWMVYSFSNRFAKHATWEWMKQEWNWLESKLGTDLSFYRFPIYSARNFSSKEFLKDYKAFYEPRLSLSLDRSYRQGIELIEWQTEWKERDLKTIKHFFKDRSS